MFKAKNNEGNKLDTDTNYSLKNYICMLRMNFKNDGIFTETVPSQLCI